jgi:hypothetical protein
MVHETNLSLILVGKDRTLPGFSDTKVSSVARLPCLVLCALNACSEPPNCSETRISLKAEILFCWIFLPMPSHLV